MVFLIALSNTTLKEQKQYKNFNDCKYEPSLTPKSNPNIIQGVNL